MSVMVQNGKANVVVAYVVLEAAEAVLLGQKKVKVTMKDVVTVAVVLNPS
jgi:hypothetical protein